MRQIAFVLIHTPNYTHNDHMKLQNKLSIFYSFPLACVMHLFQCPCLKLVCCLWQNNHKNIRFFQFVLWNHNRCKLIIFLIYCNIKRHIQLMTLVPYCNFNAMTLTLMKSFRKYFIDEKSRLLNLIYNSPKDGLRQIWYHRCYTTYI